MFRYSKSRYPDFKKIYHSAQNLYDDLPVVKKRRLARKYFKIIKYLSVGLVVVFLLSIIFFGGAFIALQSVYSEALSGKDNLEQAVAMMENRKFDEAATYAKNAAGDFQLSLDNLDKAKEDYFARHSVFVKTQLESSAYLFNAAIILSGAIERGAVLGGGLEGVLGENKKMSFSQFTQSEKGMLLERFYSSTPELKDMQKDMDTALSDLRQVNFSGVLSPVQGKVADLMVKISAANDLLGEVIPMSNLLPRLSGYPKKASYLLVLQNNDELRPTGGFMGTYGIMELDAGEITRLDTHDIYHLDMPVQSKINIAPPDPIKKYLNPKWYMRDANWYPDWPTSAEKILWFYKTEDSLLPPKNQINNFRGEFSGVIAITPKLVSDLLTVTGPIYIGDQEYDPSNFVDILQYKVEKGYAQLGVPSWQRKEVIGEIIKQLKIRLFDLPSSRWGEIINLLKNSATNKDVLVYARDRDLEKEITAQGWGGEIKNTPGDYLMAVDANMAALKTDSVMGRNLEYKLARTADGLMATLNMNYANKGTFTWKTQEYKTYTRIYVPLGSKFISLEGGESEITTGSESGKTFFGVYFKVQPGKIKNLVLKYQLPARLGNSRPYELYMQKQPGKQMDDITVDLTPGNGVKSYSPTGFYATKNGLGIKWNTDLNTDREFIINF